jgi:mRNA-degrading endonuclease RelE of RelBE toxin-antitoxin system
LPPAKVELTQSAEREFRKLSCETRGKFVEAIDALAAGKRADTQRLRGTRAIFRLRIGDHRGVYERKSGLLVFTRFAPRSTVYEVR